MRLDYQSLRGEKNTQCATNGSASQIRRMTGSVIRKRVGCYLICEEQLILFRKQKRVGCHLM